MGDLLDRDTRIVNDPGWIILHNGPHNPAGHGKHIKEQGKGKRDVDYWKTLQRTKFAVHIHGASPFSARLFEIIVAGAVPIIIAPGYVLPFEDFLDWDQFSIRVEPSEVHRLYDIVHGISEDRYARLSMALSTVSHHF